MKSAIASLLIIFAAVGVILYNNSTNDVSLEQTFN